MLIPRRIFRRRNWRDLFHSMTAFLGLSALLFFCCNVFKANTNPLNVMGPLTSNEAEVPLTYIQRHDRETINRDPGLAALAVQRHNRVLQFMGSQKYGKDSADHNDINVVDSSESLHVKTRTFNALQFKPEVVKENTKQQTYPEKINPVADSPFFLEEGTKAESISELGHAGHVPQEELLPSENSESSKKDIKRQENLLENKDLQLGAPVGRVSVRPTTSKTKTNPDAVKRLPKAIIIGVKKAGTRALLEFLRIHPQMEGSGPEPHFFDKNYQKGFEWYRELMPKTTADQITIEKTPAYFITPEAPKRIFDMDPTVKIILVVRNPVTRAISDYCQAASKAANLKPVQAFEEMAMLDERLGLINTSWGAIKTGIYAKHMENWLHVFPFEQIHIVDGQKLIEEPAQELGKVEKFLGLPSYVNDSHFYLRGFKGTFPCLIKGGRPHCLNEKTKGRDHPPVKEHVLQRLRDFYRPFNAKFYQMVNRNFGWDD